MSPELAGIIGVAALFGLLAMGIPVACSFITVGLLGLLYLGSTGAAFSALATIPYAWVANYGFAPIVLFILMASFFSHAGIAGDLYVTAQRWVGKIRGGLGIATVIACGAFAAICGSSIATAGAMGRIAIPEMRKVGYDERLSAGCATAGGTLGILIPPSITFIIYGLLVEESIGKLFMAGILPGILEIVSYSMVILLIVRLFPTWAPGSVSYSFKERFSSLRSIWPAVVLIVLVLGGIYLGVFTPTEAGAVGCTVALLLALVKKSLTFKNFADAFLEAGTLSCALFFMIIGAMVFNRFLALSNLPFLLAEVGQAMFSPLELLWLVGVVYLILGCFMDPAAMIILTIPIFYPMVKAVGISLIWFGVIVVRWVEVGCITPPVGLNLFTVSTLNPDIPFARIVQGVIPFFVMDLICIAILVLFPQISLFIPSTMKW